MRKLVLFDIDGTLVLTGRAGMRAMNRACEEIVGHTDALDGIPVAGRTDWIILHDTLGRIGRQLDEGLFNELRASYLTHLRDEIVLPETTLLPIPSGPERASRVRCQVCRACWTGCTRVRICSWVW